VNHRIRGQACGPAIDPARWHGDTPFNVKDDELTVCRNQYQHHRVPFSVLWRIGFAETTAS
jgi:hypothetical protein